ncbi:type I pantothenate kinase [Tengunoibacter tsumagoiensis]
MQKDFSIRQSDHHSRYLVFSREEWARLRASTPLTLSEERLLSLRSLNDRISLMEVEQIYLPLSRLLNLYVTAVQNLHTATATFLARSAAQVPYVIGIAGSVAVGKSTTARLLQALLSDWPSRPHVELITTDGFLWPNRVLEERNLMQQKGFPESYDVKRLVRCLAALKAGTPEVQVPMYSHLIYDIIPDQMQTIHQPDILIVEGLNVLQTGDNQSRQHNRPFVSDFFDFTIYVDAEEKIIEHWYLERFLTLRETAFRDPSSYFKRYADLSVDEAMATAHSIWAAINGPNLQENILPTRERAQLILRKGKDHFTEEVKLRKL